MSESQTATTLGNVPDQTAGLRGSLGITSIVLMVVATAAPLTVMVANTPLIISMGNGIAAPFDAAVATLIMLLFTVGFVAMSKYIGNAGAFYAYIQKGLGRTFGLGSATMAMTSYFFILVALEAYIGYALAELLLNFAGIQVPWWLLSLGTIAVVGFLGYRHIELSSRFLGLALILEIAIVLAVDLAIVLEHGPSGMDLAPFSLAAITSGSPGLGIMFAIYCFIGFEATVIYREEARDPERTIPRATYTAVLIVGSFYVISMWCEVVGIGIDDVLQFASDHPGDMYLILTENYLGKASQDLLQVLLVTSLFACVLAIHNIVVRYQYVLGRYGVLDRRLAGVHPRHGSPHVSSLVQTISSYLLLLALIAIGLDPVTEMYAWGATAGTLGYMAILALTCISVIVFFRRHREDSRLWNTCLAPAGGLLGLLTCLWIAIANLPALIGGEGAQGIAWAIGLVVIGSFIVGFVMAQRIKRQFPARFEALRALA
ncbi:amino acid permease [Stutzerimonas kirkiae]|uniref:Amino acid permease n=1 Tax=Stutzerimonas kirkiae TaxID=2211392 RepID=A0A4V2KCC3_9GAMM|nr:APC family permease [Stutzerimonas kirkiae]TBU93299.1 amino acid permease [Stutzerimonas kirkiae]TBV01433.1 amino acid permease [Stutzerimonas kirkiae]TBV10372.1 amino acid permease [Stutzerimonas kirkiae]